MWNFVSSVGLTRRLAALAEVVTDIPSLLYKSPIWTANVLEIRFRSKGREDGARWAPAQHINGAVERFRVDSALRVQAHQFTHDITDDIDQPAFGIFR